MKKVISYFVAISVGFSLFGVFSYSTAQAAVANCNFTRNLYQGVSGNDVLCLQKFLNSAGFAVAASGAGSPGSETTFYGSLTRTAVAKWQAANNISPAAGYFGTISRAKFNELNQVATGAPTANITANPSNVDLVNNINSTLAGLKKEGRPVDPITKAMGSSDTGWIDKLRALFLNRNNLPLREMKQHYSDAGQSYDMAVGKLKEAIVDCNNNDYISAVKKYDLAKLFYITDMNARIEMGMSFFPEVSKVANTLFLYDAITLPISLVTSFLTPISDGIVNYAANPDYKLSTEAIDVVRAETMEGISFAISKLLKTEDFVNKQVGQSFMWEKLAVIKDIELKQDIMRHIAAGTNIIVDKATNEAVDKLVGDILTNSLTATISSPPPSQTLYVSLSASPSLVAAGQSVSLTANVSGTAQGTINYTFYCDRSDSGANITSDWNVKFDGISDNPKTAANVCNYSTPSTYTAKVIAERGSASPAEARITINVASSPTPTLSPSSTPVPTPTPSSAPTSSVSVACSFTRDLYQGVSGNDVQCLQKYLNASGFVVASSGSGSSGNETNYFGVATENAVIKWQTANGIFPASGYFGAISRAKYNNPLFQKQTQTQQGNSMATSSIPVPSIQPITQNVTPPSACTPNWSCTIWSTCANNQQARTCVDTNNCGTTTNKPSLVQSCSPMPFSTLTSDFGGVNYGTGTTLHWSSSNAATCTASGGWNGNKALSGSENTGPLYSTQTFVLTCTGPGGAVSQSTSVSVSPLSSTATTNPSSPTLTFSAASGWVKYGQGTTLQWSSLNITSCNASGGWSGNKPLSGSEGTGSLYSTQTFVLTCTGPGGSVSRSASVGIQNAPEIAIVDSYAGTQGKPFNLSGSNFTPNGGVTLHFGRPDGSFYPAQHTQANYYGGLSFSWLIPADATPGNSSVSATDDVSGMQTTSIGFKVIAATQTTGDLTLSVSPASGPLGTVFTISGKNFTPNSSDIIHFEKPDTNQYQAQQPAADSNGNLTFGWYPPDNAQPGMVSIWALDNATGRRSPTVSVEITAQ